MSEGDKYIDFEEHTKVETKKKTSKTFLVQGFAFK